MVNKLFRYDQIPQICKTKISKINGIDYNNRKNA